VLPSRAKGSFRFGSLIGRPLHGASRAQGTTVFVDPATWQPYPDHFDHLSAHRASLAGRGRARLKTMPFE
jgi:hypothetical protein